MNNHLRKRPGEWTDEATLRARQLIAEKADVETYMRELGRSKAAAFARVRYADDPDAYREGRNRDKRGAVTAPKKIERFYIPDDVLQAAARRSLAERSITALIFGDPAPGYSALDRKQSAEVAA